MKRGGGVLVYQFFFFFFGQSGWKGEQALQDYVKIPTKCEFLLTMFI